MAIRSSPKHSCWLTEWEWPHSYLRRPWKTKKFLFQSPNFDHRNWTKINTSLCCSNFAVVDHAVYSLWVRWCLFKSGTLPLTLHKFIRSVSFLKFFRKTPRWAKSVPTAGEKPLLITLRTKIQVMVPIWLKKFQNGPASFWDLLSSYLVRNIALTPASQSMPCPCCWPYHRVCGYSIVFQLASLPCKSQYCPWYFQDFFELFLKAIKQKFLFILISINWTKYDNSPKFRYFVRTSKTDFDLMQGAAKVWCNNIAISPNSVSSLNSFHACVVGHKQNVHVFAHCPFFFWSLNFSIFTIFEWLTW